MQDRIFKLADRLLNAQLAKAEGVVFLFRRAKHPDTGFVIGKAEVVKDEGTIRQYLDGELDGDPLFYYDMVAAERPDAEAADKLLNRAFGKPKESMEVSGPDGGDVPVLHRVQVVVRPPRELPQSALPAVRELPVDDPLRQE
ncbi:MAG: hypothetical protein ABL982_03490 [Vicinamibacterales bacterium]